MTKLSIILPIKNDSKNLKKTINSIIQQTLDDIELICIDCGCKEDSLSILNKFSKQYDFINIFSQKKDTISDAKNYGMDKSNGEYISFLNANEFFINEHSLKEMYDFAKMKDANVVTANAKLINKNNKFSKIEKLEYYDEYDEISSKDYTILESLNKNIIKKEFLKENNIKFQNLSIGYDSIFLAEILKKTDIVYTVPMDFYAYSNLNIVNNCNDKNYQDYIEHFKIVFDCLSDSKFDKIKHEYRYNLLDSIDLMDNTGKKNILKSVQETFNNEPTFLRNFEENFYFKNLDNDELKDLIDFTNNLNKPRISVLIPVYNAKDFLDDSITSLLNQTFTDFELVCVNDGSKDNSLEILKKFAKQDSRVKVIDKPNGGCGSARNRALDEAKGKYMYFFDPDDEISLNTFEETYKNAIYNDTDIVIFKSNIIIDDKINNNRSFFNVQNTFTDIKNFDNFTFNYLDAKELVLSWDFAPWGKLYKKEFLDSYDDFRFNIGVAFDDVPFHVKSMLRAKRISFVNKFLYHYRMDNVNSVNNTSSNGFDIFKIMDIVEDILKKEGYFEEFEMEFNKFIVAHSLFYIVSTNSEDYYKTAKEKFEKIKDQYAPPFPKYKLVMETEDYDEFKIKFIELEFKEEETKLLNKINKLQKENKKLKKDNKKLKKINKNLLNSTSWKVTKPLRSIKNKM